MKKLLLTATALILTSAGIMAQTYYLDEDFESGIPSTWSQSTLATDGGWNAGTSAALSSGSFVIPAHTNIIATNDDDCNCDKSADSLFTDSIDLSAASGLLILQYDKFYSELTYQGATEDLKIAVYSESFGSWSILSDVVPTSSVFVWEDETMLDISAYAGDTIVLAFVYNDGSGWTYGAALDNVAIYEAAQYDIANISINNNIYHLVNTPLNITGTITNMGSEVVTSVEMSYSVDGGAAVTATISGLNLSPLASTNYTHPTAWTPTVEQLSTVVTSVVSVNGNADANAANDNASLDILVHPTPVPRKPLLEQFTSSTCPPCTPGNANVLAVMANFPGEYSKVNYQMSWPGNGDPYYTLEGLDRRTFYNVNSVPSMHTDGSAGLNSNSFTASVFTNAKAVPAFINMSIQATVQPEAVYEMQNGQIVKIDSMYNLASAVTVNPVVDLPAGLRLFVSVNENLTYNNVETNGETEFHDVMKKMLPDAAGNALAAITSGNSEVINNTHTFVGSYRLPADATDPINHSIEHSIEEWDDLQLVAWVQNISTGEIWQSENAEISLLPETSNKQDTVIDGQDVVIIDGEEWVMWDDSYVPLGVENSVAALFSIYPNPANDFINIVGTSGTVMVKVYDANGRLVMDTTVENNSLGVQNLAPGIYNLSIENNGIRKMEKLTIVR